MNRISEKRARNLARLLHPRSVCILGGQGMAEAIRHCADMGFTGDIWVVNPKHAEIGGRRTYPNLAALPAPPDIAYIAVPREATVDLVGELAAMGAGAAICYAAGFAEVGGIGDDLQRRLIAAAGDLALVGPNCYGMLNYLDGLALWPTGHIGRRVTSGAALVAQSGNIALNLTANDRSVPFAYVISSGNQTVLDVAAYVSALADEPKVSVIGLYIEGIGNVAEFSQAAAKALAAGKPIVALKAGSSQLGGELAMSHTSSLAGNDRLYDALFARLGIMRARSLPELLETMKLVSSAGLPAGDSLAVFTCSGGDSLMTADIAEGLGLTLKPHSSDQIADLRRQLPDFATIANPLDYNTSLWGHEDKLTECFSTVLAGDYDAGMLILDFVIDGAASERACNIAVSALIAAAGRHGKMPIVTATLPELLPKAVRDGIIARGGAPLQGLPEALAAFAAAARFAAYRRKIATEPMTALYLPDLPALGEERLLLGEAEAKAKLSAYGLAVPKGAIVSPEDAPAKAREIGFPVVLKIADPVIAHKTEAGAVAVNLGDSAAVEAALARMGRSLAAYRPGARIERVLVERMIGDVVAELILGIKRDPQFGLILVIGAGGILVEMVEDSVTLLLPTSAAEIEAALSHLKIGKVLAGYRGRPGADRAAILRAAMSLVDFAEAHRDSLVELDVNPLMATPTGAIAADALIVMGKADGR